MCGGAGGKEDFRTLEGILHSGWVIDHLFGTVEINSYKSTQDNL